MFLLRDVYVDRTSLLWLLLVFSSSHLRVGGGIGTPRKSLRELGASKVIELGESHWREGSRSSTEAKASPAHNRRAGCAGTGCHFPSGGPRALAHGPRMRLEAHRYETRLVGECCHCIVFIFNGITCV